MTDRVRFSEPPGKTDVPSSRSGVLALGLVVALGSGVIWWVERPDAPSDANAARAPVRIVAAGNDAATSTTRGPAVAVGSARPEAAPDLAQMTVNERSEFLDRRPRDPAWSPRIEAGLREQLRGAAVDVVPETIRCADTVCSVRATVPAGSPSERERLVDALVRGGLHPAYDRAGVKPMQAISIEVDDDGNLHFTEYLQRKS